MMDNASGKIEVVEENIPLLVIAEEESPDEAPALISIEEAAPEPTVSAQPEAAPVAKRAGKSAAPQAKPLPTPALAATPAIELPAPAVSQPAPSDADAHSAKPVKSKSGLRQWIPLAAVSIATFASMLAAIGILMASRMVAETNVVLEDIRTHQAKTRRLDTLIEEIDALRSREQLALVRLEQVNAGKPATGQEVRSAIAGLQMALAKYQPGGENSGLTLLRDGQSELGDRVATIYRRMDQMDGKIDRLINANPKARTAGDRGPTS